MSKHAPPYPNAATDPFNKVPGMNKPSATSTADKVELLPLPEQDGSITFLLVEGFVNKPAYLAETVRTCVAHATAAQAAEIEALRAEVDEWKAIATWEKEQHDRLFKEARALNERAERLAEALREYGLPLTGDDRRDEWEFGAEAVAREKRRLAALHPAAAQENDDA